MSEREKMSEKLTFEHIKRALELIRETCNHEKRYFRIGPISHITCMCGKINLIKADPKYIEQLREDIGLDNTINTDVIPEDIFGIKLIRT